jgi:hypothetical protein
MAFYHRHAPNHREHKRPLPDYSAGRFVLAHETAVAKAENHQASG